ncbi:MAG TPA: hypothetical protein VJ962_04525 [Clostridia bacterium]|nr:hypothetical protein [Clostridia bacterium]
MLFGILDFHFQQFILKIISSYKIFSVGIWLISIKLIFIGQSSRPELYITNYKNQYYWVNLKSMIIGDVLLSILEWIGVTIVGGGFIGFIACSVYLHSVNISFRK